VIIPPFYGEEKIIYSLLNNLKRCIRALHHNTLYINKYFNTRLLASIAQCSVANIALRKSTVELATKKVRKKENCKYIIIILGE
jgi:hypothetical protein